MSFKFSHAGDFHLDEEHYFADTAQCIEWFIEDGIHQGTNLFVLNGDLTTYKQTIRERKFWVDAIIRMAEHAPVLLIAAARYKNAFIQHGNCEQKNCATIRVHPKSWEHLGNIKARIGCYIVVLAAGRG
jgi:hypothetical protein